MKPKTIADHSLSAPRAAAGSLAIARLTGAYVSSEAISSSSKQMMVVSPKGSPGLVRATLKEVVSSSFALSRYSYGGSGGSSAGRSWFSQNWRSKLLNSGSERGMTACNILD